MSTFSIGDRVRVSPDAQWTDPARMRLRGMRGDVIAVVEDHGRTFFTVRFESDPLEWAHDFDPGREWQFEAHELVRVNG